MTRQTRPVGSVQEGRLRGVWQRRYLIERFAARELRSRYLGTVLGSLWSLIVPIFTVLIYSAVFTLVFTARPPALPDGRPGVYALWFFCGLIAWSFFINGVMRSVTTLLGSGRMMQKIYLPAYVPVTGTLLAVAVQLAIETAIVFVILAVLGIAGWSLLALPLWLVVFAVFVGSVALILSIANIYVRDVAVILPVALQLLFFLTPVIYPITAVPEDYRGIPLRSLIAANPMAEFVSIFRSLTYDTALPSMNQVLVACGWTLVAVVAASLVYRRFGRAIAERA